MLDIKPYGDPQRNTPIGIVLEWGRRIRRRLEKLPRGVGHFFYWLRTHTYNRYHLVDCRCSQNGYAWGWLDRSELLLFAAMAILKGYVDKESHQIDWDSDDWPRHLWKEMSEILEWWERGRKVEHDAYDALLTKVYGDDCLAYDKSRGYVLVKEGQPEWEEDRRRCHEMEAALERTDEEMLIRLVKIRGCLWS
jgi:hypothetical protein